MLCRHRTSNWPQTIWHLHGHTCISILAAIRGVFSKGIFYYLHLLCLGSHYRANIRDTRTVENSSGWTSQWCIQVDQLLLWSVMELVLFSLARFPKNGAQKQFLLNTLGNASITASLAFTLKYTGDVLICKFSSAYLHVCTAKCCLYICGPVLFLVC